ncbi:GNAT family N-acetyltransferase [Alkalihalobacillus sp. AL-G]|uniref:GNAT family N-acetyltransferase n=1 Tax=Alkalihalobacillus sp. AL-G TaxID=2926399 RepID=UPI00272AB50B|nr:GNAT family N-acetyltransferase [Alkalihalobacillus sp. AL-G]WLD94548.1 GNAT family N-acetyltransferase [Alkalihalobacillus sp. AL-G]
METIELVETFSDEEYLEQMVEIFLNVHNIGDRTSVEERFRRHSTYPGFRRSVAIDDENKVLGFVYGYTSLPEQFYNGKLRAQMTYEQVEKWLSNCFEFVELAVDPYYHRNGLGSKLHDSILEKTTHKTSILTTGAEMAAAQALYKRKGWETIQTDVDVLGAGKRQLIMGKKL